MHSVFVCLIMVSTAIGTPQVNITATYGPTVVVAPDNFEFYCSSNVSANFTVEVDGLTEGDKFDRITDKVISVSKVEYEFPGTGPSDNGTTFMCVATINDTNYTSEVLTIQVHYSPVFLQNNSNPVLYEIRTNAEKVELHCNVMANPAANFSFTNDSSNSAGVTTEIKDNNAKIIFKKAVVDNRGTYNCTATNSIGNDTLTYKVFVGGMPNGVNISCESDTSFVFQYVCKVHDDSSDAPATALILESPGLGIYKKMEFQESDLPLSDVTFTLLNTSLLEVVPDNYSLYLYAVNQLGNTSVLNATFYLGLNINVSISTDNATVLEKESFNFTCSSLKANATYAVRVGGSETQDRLNSYSSTTMSQSFSYNYTTYEDNDRTFQCLANATINGTVVLFESSIIKINVLYAPRYALGSVIGTPLNNSKEAVITILDYTANPSFVKVNWTYNGTVLKNNTLPDQLILHNVLVTDSGNYTVHTCNVAGCGNGMVTVDVYYAPQYAAVTLATPLNGSAATLNISSYQANPKADNVTWTYNGTVFKNNTLPDQLILHNVLVKDRGSYTVHTCNVVGCGNGTVTVDVYYPPLLSGNTNGSQWIEIRTNDSYNITCTVVDSNPPVTHLNFTYNGSSDNVRIIHNNDTSKTLVITKATQDNAINYTCEATSTVATSRQVFQTFVGGAPHKVVIENISVVLGDGKDPVVTISINVTDGSSAPARSIIYNIKGNTTNHTVPILAPIRAAPVSLNISSVKVSSYGADQVTILFYAANDLGSVYITKKNIIFSSPTTPPITPKPKPKSHSHAGAIVAGILVPLFVIVLILVGVAAGWYFYRKRMGGGKYVRLNIQGKDVDDAGDYGATS